MGISVKEDSVARLGFEIAYDGIGVGRVSHYIYIYIYIYVCVCVCVCCLHYILIVDIREKNVLWIVVHVKVKIELINDGLQD